MFCVGVDYAQKFRLVVRQKRIVDFFEKRAGFGVARVHIPETGVCKAMPFSPVQTVGHFLELLRLALPSPAQMRLPWAQYVLALPVRVRDTRTHGCVVLEPRQTFSMYGLGSGDTVVPLLLLPDQHQQHQQQQQQQQQQQPQHSERGARSSASVSSISLGGRAGGSSSLGRSRSAAQLLPHRGSGEDAAAGEHEGGVHVCGVDVAELASAFDSTSLDSVPCVGRWLAVLPWCGETALSAARSRELRKLVLAGVPECIRGDVWMRLSQARAAMHQDVNNTYQVCPFLFFLFLLLPLFECDRIVCACV